MVSRRFKNKGFPNHQSTNLINRLAMSATDPLIIHRKAQRQQTSSKVMIRRLILTREKITRYSFFVPYRNTQKHSTDQDATVAGTKWSYFPGDRAPLRVLCASTGIISSVALIPGVHEKPQQRIPPPCPRLGWLMPRSLREEFVFIGSPRVVCVLLRLYHKLYSAFEL